ncbi:MAG TPA: hypothetical protein DEA84_05725 [Erwinia persicina]|nr:hypothetical protein [Erwinia persicina]HBT52989.1 hypothetical protein [Erwinia persicina]
MVLLCVLIVSLLNLTAQLTICFFAPSLADSHPAWLALSYTMIMCLIVLCRDDAVHNGRRRTPRFVLLLLLVTALFINAGSTAMSLAY